MKKFIVKCGNDECGDSLIIEAKEDIDFIDEDGQLRSTPLDRPGYACTLCGSEDVEILEEVEE